MLDFLLALVFAPFLLAVSMAWITIVTAPFTLLRAWVLTKLWLWFLVPLGLPVLAVLPAVGLILTYSFIRGIKVKDIEEEQQEAKMRTKKENRVRFFKGLLTLLASPLLSLLFGYLVHRLM